MTSTPTRPVVNVVITTKGLQERNNLLLDGRTVENKGKLILKELDSIMSSSKTDNVCTFRPRSGGGDNSHYKQDSVFIVVHLKNPQIQANILVD